MANRQGTSSPEPYYVFVETNLDTRLITLVHRGESFSDFKDKIRKEHERGFPQVGEISITALKYKIGDLFYQFSDGMIMSSFYNGTTQHRFMYADVVRVEKCESLTITAAHQNCSNPELLEKNKETSIDTITVYGHTKELTSEEALETEVVKKESRKRKIKSSDTKQSRKKPANDINQSAVAKCAVDDILISSVGTEFETGENNDISMGENQKASDAGRLGQEKTDTINSELVDGDTMDEEKDVQANQTPQEALETELATSKTNGSDENHKSCGQVPTEKLDHLTGAIEQDLAPTLELADGQITSRDDVNENPEVETGLAGEQCATLPKEMLEILLPGAIEKDNERGEGSRLAPSAADNMQTDNFVSHPENQLEASSGLTTEKKKRRKKSLKDQINQSPAAVTSTSTDIVNDISGVPGNIDCVDATPKSCLISRRETLENPLAEAMQKENEMGEKIDKDVGSGKAIPSASENIQTATEKKKKRKKSTKDHISQSTGAAPTTSRETVNERDTASEGEKLADTPVVVQNENEMVDKLVDNAESKEATFTGADNLQPADMASTQVQESKTVEHTEKITNEKTTREDGIAKDNAEMDVDEAKSVKSTKKKKSRKAKTPAVEETSVASGAQNVEPIKVAEGEEPDNVIRNVLDTLEQRDETQENLGKSGKKSSKKSKKSSLNIVEAQVEVNNAAQEKASAINNPKDTDASSKAATKDTESDATHLKKSIEVVANNTEDNTPSKQIQKEKVDMGDEVSGGAKSKKEKKSIKKPKERNSRVEPASSGTSQLQSRVKKNESKVNHSDASAKRSVTKKKEVEKKSSNPVAVERNKLNFFKYVENWDSTDDESNKTPYVYTETPLASSSSDDDSDVTHMSRKQGNNASGGANLLTGNLQDILRSSKSYKKAKLTASQQQDDDSPQDCVPDSQAH